MPRIEGYDEHVVAQGALGGQASAADFGGQIGQGLQQLGAGIGDLGAGINQYQQMKDSTDVAVDMASKRATFNTMLKDAANSAAPGDDTFAPRFKEEMDKQLEKDATKVRTPHGERLYAQYSANLSTELYDKAVSVQSELAARGAVNSYNTIQEKLGQVVYSSPSDFESAKAQGFAAIDDPTSIYGKIPQPKREELKQALANNLAASAMSGVIRNHPETLLGSFAPDQLAKFKPWESIMKAGTVPGGSVNVSDGTLAKAETIIPQASAKAVNPNIAMALADKTPAQDPAKTTGDLADLLKKYGGSYDKALAATKMGAPAVDGLIEAYDDGWSDALPFDTATYVDSVKQDAGQLPAESDPPAKAAPTPPAAPQQVPPSSLSFVKDLTWEQVDRGIKESVQLVNMQRSNALMARELADHEAAEAQKATFTKYTQQILNPGQFGRFSVDAMTKDNLTGNQMAQLNEMFTSRVREAQTEGKRSNPAVVNDLFSKIIGGKMFDTAPIAAAYNAGSLSIPDYERLTAHLTQQKDGNAVGFNRRYAVAVQSISDGIRDNPIVSAQFGLAASLRYTILADLDAKIKDRRDKNEDPSVLLDPHSSDYFMKPALLQSYLPSTRTVLAKGAQNTADAAKAGFPTYENAKPGEPYLAPDGSTRMKGK